MPGGGGGGGGGGTGSDAEAILRCREFTKEEELARREFQSYLDREFTPTNSITASGVKYAITLAIQGARGAVIEGLSGAIGASVGGFLGWVIGASTAAIASPVVDPLLRAGLTRAFDWVNSSTYSSLRSYCGQQKPFVLTLPILSIPIHTRAGRSVVTAYRAKRVGLKRGRSIGIRRY